MANYNGLGDEEILSLSNQFCFSMYACSREITKLYHPLLKQLNLTYPQYLVMLVLWENLHIIERVGGAFIFIMGL